MQALLTRDCKPYSTLLKDTPSLVYNRWSQVKPLESLNLYSLTITWYSVLVLPLITVSNGMILNISSNCNILKKILYHYC